MTLFERTRDTAKERGYNLQTTAKKAGLSNNAIYNWKSVTPSHVSLKAVADVLNVSVDYLLGNTDKKNPRPAKNEENVVDLDKALSEEGMAMFDGQPLSEDYKKALLAMLKTMRGE